MELKPIEALTGILELPGAGKIRLDFLITYESNAYYIRCLDFGIMSNGKTIDECKENIIEAILIYLEDIPEGHSFFKPALQKYWKMFYELRLSTEESQIRQLTLREKDAIYNLVKKPEMVNLQYA